MLKRQNKTVCQLGLGVAFASAMSITIPAQAGFLEMPDTTEVPEYERESMLLDLDIPPVRDRDPDPEGGPRLNVKEFRLQGVVEYPELGITREDLIKRIEGIRFDIMDEGKMTDSGYTLSELGELSDLIGEIEDKTEGQHVGPLEVQKLVFLIRDQRRRRGVTLGMIETVADTITKYYREKGFILAKAYIPEQKVRDGVVILTLLLGELGEVALENNKRVSPALVNRVFKKDIHKPVTSQAIEESLYLVNDIPGLSAQGFFSPGGQVGDTKLSVNVTQEKWYTANVRLDNHGSESTGQNRAYAELFIHNPLGIGDEIQLSVLNSFDPDNTTYGAFRYNTFLYSPRLRGAVGISSNDFVSSNLTRSTSGNQNTTVNTYFTGDSLVADASLTYIFRRSRVENYSANLTYTDISTSLNTITEINGNNSTGTNALVEDDVANISLGFNFDVLLEKQRQLHAGDITLTMTDTIQGQEGNTGLTLSSLKKNAFFLNMNYSMLSFVNIPFTDIETRVVARASAQYAGKSMTNVNQFNMTGPSRTRGFAVNAVQFDDALYTGVDWVLPFPRLGGLKLFGHEINRIFQPYVFVDAGYGATHPYIEGDGVVEGKLMDVGVGLKFKYAGLSGNLSFANPSVDDVGEDEETPTNSVYFDVLFNF